MDRPKIRKRIMTVIKDTWGVIRIIETYDDNYIKYYVQSAYNKDIFGIGRDTTQSLAQVQSKSINDSSVLSIQAVGEGTNINPAFVDITNNEFFTVANNGE